MPVDGGVAIRGEEGIVGAGVAADSEVFPDGFGGARRDADAAFFRPFAEQAYFFALQVGVADL